MKLISVGAKPAQAAKARTVHNRSSDGTAASRHSDASQFVDHPHGLQTAPQLGNLFVPRQSHASNTKAKLAAQIVANTGKILLRLTTCLLFKSKHYPNFLEIFTKKLCDCTNSGHQNRKEPVLFLNWKRLTTSIFLPHSPPRNVQMWHDCFRFREQSEPMSFTVHV